MTRTTYIEDLGEGKIGDTKTREKRAVSNTKQGSANDFPDLSGDGDVTMKDILIGKGVIKKSAQNQKKNLYEG